MNHLEKIQAKVFTYLFALVLTASMVVGILWWALSLVLPTYAAAIIAFVIGTLLALLAAKLASDYVLSPLKIVWQAIMHVAPNNNMTAPPNVENAKLGRELLTSLTLQIYQLASGQQDNEQADDTKHRSEVIQAANVVRHLPVPLFVFNKQQIVVNASDTALEYCHIDSPKLFGKPLYDSLNLEFPSEHTLETWVIDCQKNKVTDKAYWERVRLRLPDGELRQCDMAAYYNRDNPSGTEFIVTMFDHTEQYNQDDQSLSFIALAVHELRTPLTMLRGYIEVISEELKGQLNQEQTEYLHKLELSGETLTAFVNNILNVARVEEDQLTLQLVEEKWEDVVKAAVGMMQLRAQVYGKTIVCKIAPDLPTVGVDRVSAYEIINNLLDNALKYSGDGEQVIVSAQLDSEGMVETTVQDFGVGIPQSVLPNIFDKFYRNHRTKTQIGGTGLGLYLSKSLVAAHGGKISVKSKEGKGSTFGFTVQPFTKLAEELKNSNNKDIVRQAHGWIKNHSMYRR